MDDFKTTFVWLFFMHHAYLLPYTYYSCLIKVSLLSVSCPKCILCLEEEELEIIWLKAITITRQEDMYIDWNHNYIHYYYTNVYTYTIYLLAERTIVTEQTKGKSYINFLIFMCNWKFQLCSLRRFFMKGICSINT